MENQGFDYEIRWCGDPIPGLKPFTSRESAEAWIRFDFDAWRKDAPRQMDFVEYRASFSIREVERMQ